MKSQTNLSRANLTNALLNQANLTSANLFESNLTKTVFNSANLTDTNFKDANFSKTLHNFANIEDAINVPQYYWEQKQQTTPLLNVLEKIFEYHSQNNPVIASCLQAGLEREEIDELLKDIPYAIPEELYQLYGWRNGMSEKGIQNYRSLIFADRRGFLPLNKVIEDYKYMITLRWEVNIRNRLAIFPSATDTTFPYTIVLGGENLAPVYNFDDEYNNYSREYESIFSMMSKFMIGK